MVVWGDLATPAGFEPAISTVTGWHVRPLHHGAVLVQQVLGGSNQILYVAKVYQGQYIVSS